MEVDKNVENGTGIAPVPAVPDPTPVADATQSSSSSSNPVPAQDSAPPSESVEKSTPTAEIALLVNCCHNLNIVNSCLKSSRCTHRCADELINILLRRC